MVPPAYRAKTIDVCAGCGERVTIPPGVYYRGVAYHRQEAEVRRQRDLSSEQKAPFLAEVRRDLEENLDL
jgi:hypothetical protein